MVKMAGSGLWLLSYGNVGRNVPVVSTFVHDYYSQEEKETHSFRCPTATDER
jgi:hypothetical protein